MKKILLLTCVLSVAIYAKTFAADTYTGALVDALNQKVNKVAAPVVNKEKELQEKQKSIQQLKQTQLEEQQKQIDAKQKAQQELINKKRNQLQGQKDLIKNETNDLKKLFSIE